MPLPLADLDFSFQMAVIIRIWLLKQPNICIWLTITVQHRSIKNRTCPQQQQLLLATINTTTTITTTCRATTTTKRNICYLHHVLCSLYLL